MCVCVRVCVCVCVISPLSRCDHVFLWLAVGLCGLLPNAVRRVVVFVLSLNLYTWWQGMRRCSARRDPRGLTSVGLSGDVGGRLAVGLCGPLPNAVRRVVVLFSHLYTFDLFFRFLCERT